MALAKCKNCPATSVNLNVTFGSPDHHPVSTLPQADFLVFVWTEAEAGALATVLTKGTYQFFTDADNNFTPLLLPGMVRPEGEQYHGYFFPVTVNGKDVVCLRSGFHPKLQPSAAQTFFETLVGRSGSYNFRYLITSGTSGGIWSTLDVGDVVVTNTARYGLTATATEQALQFTGVTDLFGSNKPSGFANWYDYANAEILAKDTCVIQGLGSPGGRSQNSGDPTIYYAPNNGSPTDVVTNSRITDDECGRIATYRTMGATLDENDAYVAQACANVGFNSWVSIRNISDLPCSSSDDQYDEFGYCSSLNGAYGVWAFLMGH